MEKSYACVDPEIFKYMDSTFKPEDSTLRAIAHRSAQEGLPPIQLSPMDALHLKTLASLCNARKAVEIGTLGGYSGVSLLRGMGPYGRLWTCEISPKNAETARASFREAGVLDQVEILVGPALETLSQIENHAPFDLVFIDADKENYPHYLNWAHAHLRRGGVVIGDNTFAFGDIYKPQKQDNPSVKALRRFNQEIAQSGKFLGTMIPTGEGLTIGVKL